jgi:hypothetical protein
MRTVASIAAFVLCCHCVVGRAQNAAYVSASLPAIYVEQFGSAMHAHRVDGNAAALSRAIVKALTNAHVAAEAVPPDGPTPKTGWLIRGVFFSTSKAANIEVTVTIADCAKDPDTPFAVIGTDSVLKAQGAPVGWNPYVVSARFVIHRVDGDKSLDRVAGEIAQKILEHRADLVKRDN